MKSTTATLLIACLVGNSLAVPYALDPVVRAVGGAHLNNANSIRSSAAGKFSHDSIVKRQAVDGVDDTVYRLVNLVQNILGTNATVTLGVGDPIEQILSSTSDQEIVVSVDSILELLNSGRAYLSGRDRNLISEVLGTIRNIVTRRGRGRGRNNKRDEAVAQEESNRRMRGILDAIVNSVGLDNSDGSIDTQPTDSLRELVNQILETLGVSSSMLPSPSDLPSIIGEALTSGLPAAAGTVSASNRTSDAVLKARDAHKSNKHDKHDKHDDHHSDHRDNDRNNGGNREPINYLSQGLGGILDAIIAGSTAFDVFPTTDALASLIAALGTAPVPSIAVTVDAVGAATTLPSVDAAEISDALAAASESVPLPTAIPDAIASVAAEEDTATAATIADAIASVAAEEDTATAATVADEEALTAATVAVEEALTAATVAVEEALTAATIAVADEETAAAAVSPEATTTV